MKKILKKKYVYNFKKGETLTKKVGYMPFCVIRCLTSYSGNSNSFQTNPNLPTNFIIAKPTGEDNLIVSGKKDFKFETNCRLTIIIEKTK